MSYIIKTGTPANSSIKPPGFEWGGSDSAGHARGHLLGNQLGGLGDDPRNLVAFYQNPTNHPVMSGFEVRRAVEFGQTVSYTSTSIYQGDSLVPSRVTISAQGSGGFSLDVTVLNRKLGERSVTYVYLEKLTTILKTPKRTYNIGNNHEWEEYQKKYNCEFPSEYKKFINAYGTGCISDFLWILTPFESNEEINIFHRAEIMYASYNYMKDLFPGEYNYSIYPEEGGLLPWGYTDNGDELYFKLTNETVVVFGARYSDFYEYDMGMVEFLYKLFMKKIKCNAFPVSFIDGVLKYNSIKI